ncbi:hypothetical protein CYMTET_10279 [Cymbomonas tetramitiformis]|uniref:C2H2-type domain-containing protein n=1 Tax=Cymbomonas tetramitiformis TaxID=36881 RepID=A0AAE0LEM2_9CHLO|nr:hypothetical protein CYMTET_10279 [Cymbomonas tetramitiformis]|eukprot:gene1594-2230_t
MRQQRFSEVSSVSVDIKVALLVTSTCIGFAFACYIHNSLRKRVTTNFANDLSFKGERKSTLRVLTLGEGDFTFSLSFVSKYLELAQVNRALPKLDILATSFDGSTDVVKKYIEGKRILRALRQQSCAHVFTAVLHNIDATQLSPTTLEIDGKGLFDLIVFQFPHLGIEDAKRHSYLLGHLFHSCSQGDILARGGRIYISLVEGQAERWELEAQAARNKLRVEGTLELREDAWPGYHVRRHQGHSFRSKSGRYRTFILSRLADEAASSAPRIYEALSSSGTTGSLLQDPTLGLHDPVPNATANSPSAPRAPVKTKKKQKTAEDSVIEEMCTGIETDGGLMYKCKPCGKLFKTAQGVRGHARQIHVLRSEGSAWLEKHATEDGRGAVCGHCGQELKDRKGLEQHLLARHASVASDDLVPDWKRQESSAVSGGGTRGTHDVIRPGDHVCAICGARFGDAADLEGHVKGDLTPMLMEEQACQWCGKRVRGKRSLAQHEAHCGLTAHGTQKPK